MPLAKSTHHACLLGLLLAAVLPANTIQLVSVEGFLHYGGGSTPQATFNTSSPTFTSSLDSNNLGTFRFWWTNNTGLALTNLTFTLFVDPDIDRDTNTFFNEYGDLVSFLLPALAPSGAISFTQWEIDEPEYVFGNIYTNSLLGALDNSTGVPSSRPDDVSHALLFRIALLNPGETMNVYGTLSATDAAGLGHHDPDSPASLYVNGYATVDPAGPSSIPEPASWAMASLAGLALLAARRRNRQQRGGRA